LGLSCDVSKEEDVQRAFETISKNCGTVGYLVNAAGINRSEMPQSNDAENELCFEKNSMAKNKQLY